MALIMQQGQKATKKWVDYSDDSEEQFDSAQEKPGRGEQHSSQQAGRSTHETVDHRTEQFVQQQVARYRQAKQNSSQIWLLLQSDDHVLLDKKIRDLKENQSKDILNIYMSRDVQGAWDIKIKEEAAIKWITEGIDRQKNIKVTVADRNFPNRERGDRPPRGRGDRGDRGDRGERRERGGRGGRRGGRDRERGDRDGRRNRDHNNQPQKKKVYVDKATGQAPSNKQECEKKVLQQKERHYTRQEAEKVGEGLGNFRNKPKVQSLPESYPVKPEPKQQYKSEIYRPKEDTKAWTRRQREQLMDNKQKREGEQQMKERKVDAQQIKEKRPDVQQFRQKKVEYRQKHSDQTTKEENGKVSDAVPDKKKQKRHYVRIDNLTEQEKAKLKLKKPQKKEKDLLSEDSD